LRLQSPGQKEYEIGVAAMVTPILSLGFAGQNPMLVKTADKKQHHSDN
jgi:hypothetical protein